MADELSVMIAEYFSERRGGRVLSPRAIEAITTFLVATLEVEDMEVVKSMDIDALVEAMRGSGVFRDATLAVQIAMFRSWFANPADRSPSSAEVTRSGGMRVPPPAFSTTTGITTTAGTQDLEYDKGMHM
jgi:hypothetical protein